MSLEVCLAINYNKSNKHCILITTSKPTNGCPKSATWKDTGIFAKSIDDLGSKRSDPDTVCYAKIPIDEKERRQTKFFLQKRQFCSNDIISLKLICNTIFNELVSYNSDTVLEKMF